MLREWGTMGDVSLFFLSLSCLYSEHSIMTVNITEREKKPVFPSAIFPSLSPHPIRKQLGSRVWAMLWGPSHLLRKGRSCSAGGWQRGYDSSCKISQQGQGSAESNPGRLPGGRGCGTDLEV